MAIKQASYSPHEEEYRAFQKTVTKGTTPTYKQWATLQGYDTTAQDKLLKGRDLSKTYEYTHTDGGKALVLPDNVDYFDKNSSSGWTRGNLVDAPGATAAPHEPNRATLNNVQTPRSIPTTTTGTLAGDGGYQTTGSSEATGAITASGNAQLERLKQRIAESKTAQQGMIDKAPQAYDPYRAQSEVQKTQQLRSALERQSNLGDRGGIGRQENLAISTAGAGRLSDINLQQQNFIDNAQAEIARLENEGKYEEAAILAETKERELTQAYNERIRREDQEREETRYQEEVAREEEYILAETKERELTQAYNERIRREDQEREDARYQEEVAREEEYRAREETKMAEEKKVSDFLTTMGQFFGDYDAEIKRNENDGDTSNDWQIPYLKTARQDKIGSLGLDQQGNPIEQGVQYSISQALEATRQGMWNQQIADALGLPYTEQGRSQAVSGGTGTEATPTTSAQNMMSDADITAQARDIYAGLAKGGVTGENALNQLASMKGQYDPMVLAKAAEMIAGEHETNNPEYDSAYAEFIPVQGTSQDLVESQRKLNDEWDFWITRLGEEGVHQINQAITDNLASLREQENAPVEEVSAVDEARENIEVSLPNSVDRYKFVRDNRDELIAEGMTPAEYTKLLKEYKGVLTTAEINQAL